MLRDVEAVGGEDSFAIVVVVVVGDGCKNLW